MRRVLLITAGVMLILSCNKESVPEGVIPKAKMVNVLTDMQLSEAYLNQVYNNDTLKMQAHSRYNYVFKKYQIDSTKFTKSLKYYSLDGKEMDAMLTQVSDSLVRLQTVLNREKEIKDSIKAVKLSQNFNRIYPQNSLKNIGFEDARSTMRNLDTLNNSTPVKQSKNFNRVHPQNSMQNIGFDDARNSLRNLDSINKSKAPQKNTELKHDISTE